MKISDSIAYENYLTDIMNKDMEMKRYIKECLVLADESANVIPELRSLNEDLKVDTQGIFKKMIDFFRKLVDKFMANIDSFIKSDESFLRKYKDTILNKKIDEYTLTDVPDYASGIELIRSIKIPKFDLTKMKGMEEKAMQQLMMPKYSGDISFVDYCKEFFLCANKEHESEVKSSRLNMGNLYKFCIDASDMTKIIKNDETDIVRSTNEVQNIVLKAIDNANKPKPTTTTEALAFRFLEYGKAIAYSTVLESYIVEADDKPSGMQIKGPEKPESPKEKLDLGVNKSTEEDKGKASDVKSDDGKDAKKAEEQAKENAMEDAKTIKSAGELYLKTIRTILGAKMTAIDTIYKAYMKIIKYHVRVATGSKNSMEKLSDEDTKLLRQHMKDYVAAEDKKDEEAMKKASDAIKSFYSTNIKMEIDDSDVVKLIAKNKSKL